MIFFDMETSLKIKAELNIHNIHRQGPASNSPAFRNGYCKIAIFHSGLPLEGRATAGKHSTVVAHSRTPLFHGSSMRSAFMAFRTGFSSGDPTDGEFVVRVQPHFAGAASRRKPVLLLNVVRQITEESLKYCVVNRAAESGCRLSRRPFGWKSVEPRRFGLASLSSHGPSVSEDAYFPLLGHL